MNTTITHIQQMRPILATRTKLCTRCAVPCQTQVPRVDLQPAADHANTTDIATNNTIIDCQHFQTCSGCSLATNVHCPPIATQAEAFFVQNLRRDRTFRIHHLKPTGWRHRARLVVRQGPDGDVVVGLFTQGTHRAVDIPLCQAHHPLINAAAELIRQCINDCNVCCYDEGTGKGELRYVQLQTTGWSPQSLPTSRPLGRTRPWSDTNDDVSQQVIASTEGEDTALQVQVVLVWNAIDYESVADLVALNRFVGQLWEAGHQPYATSLNTGASCPPLLHSIHVNFQPSRNNVILGSCTMLLRGSSDAWTYVGGVPIAFDPGSFLQVNPRAMSAVIDTMRRWVPRGARLVDLHAGVGTIGTALAATNRLQSLTLVEINPAGQQAFWKTWKALATVKNGIAIEDEGIEDGDPRRPTEGVEYHVAAAESNPARWLANADVVVVDPPRKGLEPSLLEYLCREGDVYVAPQPKILIYLSCGWRAFERDCTSLVHSGRWKLEFAEGFIFFPGADHIETLAVFTRMKKPERRRRNASRKHAKHRK